MSTRPYITCRELIEALGAYLDHELSPQMLADFQRHLSVCDSCVAYIATYEKTIRAAKGTAEYDETIVEEAPAELVEAILDVFRR